MSEDVTELIPNYVSDDNPKDLSEPSYGSEGSAGGPSAGGQVVDGDQGWKRDKQQRQYVSAQGRRGVIYRQGDETVAQALERDAKPKRDKPPRRSKTPGKTPPPPKTVDMKELERLLAEALAAPAFVCATFGDQWAADHFTNQGPNLARNLVAAADHNPWLRSRLEAAASGGDAAMKLISLVGVGGALFGYAVPPIIYWFNLPVPDKGREMFGIPPARNAQPAPPSGLAAAA